MFGGDFFIHVFFVIPVCQYLLKPNPKWTRERGSLYAIAFLALVALVSEYQAIIYQPVNYYQLVDCNRACSAAELKKSYRVQSLLLHPDKNPNNPHAQEQFTRLGIAYEILNDPEKRETYDKFGEDGLRRGRSESSILLNMAMFYIVWGMLTFVLTLGKDSAAGRNWVFTGMIVLIVCEFQMIFGDWDPLKNVFPKTTIHEKIAALHVLFPAFMNGCRIISQAMYVDFEQQMAFMLNAVLLSNQEILRGLATMNASLDRKAGKKAGAPGAPGQGTTTDDGFDGLGMEQVEGKAGADLPLGVRLRRQKAQVEASRQQLAANVEKQGRTIPPWLWMVGMYIVFNYILK